MLKNYSRLARREFVTTAVAGGGAMLLGPAWLNAATDGVDPRVAQVLPTIVQAVEGSHFIEGHLDCSHAADPRIGG